MIVCKFGGTSVQNKEAIERVIEIIRTRLKERPVVVVSAFSKVTRMLCEIADEAEAKQESGVESLIAQIRERHNSVASELLAGKPDILKETLHRVQGLCDSLEAFVKGVCMIGELSPRSQANIISTGELLSSTIVSAAMNAYGIKSRWVDARRMIIILVPDLILRQLRPMCVEFCLKNPKDVILFLLRVLLHPLLQEQRLS